MTDQPWVPEPGSRLWKYFGDIRGLYLAPQVLILQVAHPVVGAGVLEHSRYQDDPWNRFWGTYLSICKLVYGGRAKSVAESARLRTMHKTIRGTDAQGRKYHALNPEAYAWVHATLMQGVLNGQAQYGRPLRGAELDTYYKEVRQMGRLLGLRREDMPETYPEFRAYYDRMVEERLEDNDAVRDVLAAVRLPRPPRWLRWVPEPLWRLALGPVGWLACAVAVESLPPVLRDRCGLAQSAAQTRTVKVFRLFTTVVTRLTPGPVRRAAAVATGRLATSGRTPPSAPAPSSPPGRRSASRPS